MKTEEEETRNLRLEPQRQDERTLLSLPPDDLRPCSKI